MESIPIKNKCSHYWLTYTDHDGKEVISEKKCYLRNFQVEELADKPGKFKAKTDFNYEVRITQVPTIELRDWLANDVVITLWESRPVLNKVKDETTENMVDRVQIDPETELPVIETLNRGIVCLNFWHWLKKSPQNP